MADGVKSEVVATLALDKADNGDAGLREVLGIVKAAAVGLNAIDLGNAVVRVDAGNPASPMRAAGVKFGFIDLPGGTSAMAAANRFVTAFITTANARAMTHQDVQHAYSLGGDLNGALNRINGRIGPAEGEGAGVTRSSWLKLPRLPAFLRRKSAETSQPH